MRLSRSQSNGLPIKQLINADPRHPSVRLKRIGRFWSARVGLNDRALGVDGEDGILWFWIGTHAAYNRLVQQA